MKILLCLLIVISLSMFVITFPQNDLNVPAQVKEMFQADGFVFDGPASRPSNIGAQGLSTTQITNTNTNNNTETVTTPIPQTQFDSCVENCPVTPEYNPVCGTDNIDYTNPGGLGCAQRCGKEVKLNHYGRCSSA